MVMGWFIVAAGIFSICGAAFNWDWFMNHRKARFLVRVAGRTGARIFYGTLGATLAVLGTLLALGIIESTN